MKHDINVNKILNEIGDRQHYYFQQAGAAYDKGNLNEYNYRFGIVVGLEVAAQMLREEINKES